MVASPIQYNRVKTMWRRCLASAFRTALACAIVAGVTLHGPRFLTRYIAFPAFSYVTAILVVTDATLGDTFRCCWLSLYATVQGVCPAILVLWLIGPARLSCGTTAAVVGLSAFMVALPENPHLTSKRIALGQIVIVYVVGFINGGKTDPIMHPINVAASTAAGVFACVLALLLPYPSLAFCEVKENCKLYIDNSSERLKLYIEAFSAEDDTLQKGLTTRTKFLNLTASKLLQNIESKQDVAQWERFVSMFFKSYYRNPAEKLRSLETVLRGMEVSLTDCSKFPVKIKDCEIKNDLVTMEELLLNQFNNMAVEKTILPQSDELEMDSMFLPTLHSSTTPRLASKDLPSMFFIFCLRLIQIKSKRSVPSPEDSFKQESSDSSNDDSNKMTMIKNRFMTRMRCDCLVKVNKKRLLSALRCSLSLGFAVLFGSMYSKENGFWSGLPVAITHAAAREATFKVANVKLQGTVLGTVYGVMGCFVFENYVKIRFISLLPWFIFCSFLRCSKMYAQAGGISAAIGAVLILGRDNFGSPSDFAIARIVETFIGLTCSIVVDMLFHPTRASVLAKKQLSKSLKALHVTIGSITLDTSIGCSSEESQKKLKKHVNELRKFMEEAEVEPNFWFLPFHSACYSNLLVSLSRMVDFLFFGSQALGFLKQESSKKTGSSLILKEGLGVIKLEDDLKVLRDGICSWIQVLEEVSLVKSLEMLEKEFKTIRSSADLELGKPSAASVIKNFPGVTFDDDEMERITNSFLQHLDELVDGSGSDSDSGSGSSHVMVHMGALMFSMNGLVRETKEMQKAVKELVQWENPTSQVDLHAILCKIHMP